MLMMVDPGSGRWWWSGPGVGTMRRRGMGRRPARLMYAVLQRRGATRNTWNLLVFGRTKDLSDRGALA